MNIVWLIAVNVGFFMVVYSFRVERWRAENIINLSVRYMLVSCYPIGVGMTSGRFGKWKRDVR